MLMNEQTHYSDGKSNSQSISVSLNILLCPPFLHLVLLSTFGSISL